VLGPVPGPGLTQYSVDLTKPSRALLCQKGAQRDGP
jgi:hypothetical protein